MRTCQGAKPVCLTRNRVPPDKLRGTPPALPPCPAQIPIAKPTWTCTWVEIPTNDANDMGIHPFHQRDASKMKRDIAGEKINFTAPDPGNISHGKDSNTKACKDRPSGEEKNQHQGLPGPIIKRRRTHENQDSPGPTTPRRNTH